MLSHTFTSRAPLASGTPANAANAATAQRAAHTRSTFMVEALIILVCLLLVVATTMSLLAFAGTRGQQTARTQHAITLAENAAERFAANPTSVEPYVEDGYTLDIQTQAELQPVGSLLYATITVTFENQQLYQIQTARYMPKSFGSPTQEAL